MRKRKKGRKLGRKKDQRRALKKSLAREVFLKEKIKTTEAKAKEVQPFLERCLSRAKKGKRRSLSSLFDEKTVRKLVEELAKRYREREGGYTRIIKLGPRKTDGAEMVIMELV